jgi:hypothetical protein
MKSFTLENIKRDINQENLYDLFSSTVVLKDNIQILSTTVLPEEEMRLDRVCKRLYGSDMFLEEIMILNNIIDKFSIKNGQILDYFYVEQYDNFHELEKDSKIEEINKLSDPGKNTRKDNNREDSELPPTIKPANLKKVNVDKDSRKIKIINKLS